ncbi:MAG: hypothetical protein ACLFV5_08015 [Anaerolineales bacterium]
MSENRYQRRQVAHEPPRQPAQPPLPPMDVEEPSRAPLKEAKAEITLSAPSC